MERIHRSPFVTKDNGERFPVAADRRLKKHWPAPGGHENGDPLRSEP